MNKNADEFIYKNATMDEKVEHWHTNETGTTLREFLGMSQDEYDAWMISGKEPGTPLCRAIAIDFDGCLFRTEDMKIVAPNWEVIARAKAAQRSGADLILWTCREGALLDEAIVACKECGLLFDAINESLPDWIAAYGTTPRKVGASEYWDDKAIHLPAAPKNKLETARTSGKNACVALAAARMGTIATNPHTAASAAVRSPMLGGRSGLPERVNFWVPPKKNAGGTKVPPAFSLQISFS